MNGTTLVAGIGNVFLGDDGFGVEVVTRLANEGLPDAVRVLDIGIRGRDLAYELLDGQYDTAILIDAVARGGAPGTLYVIEPEITAPAAPGADAIDNGHAMNLEATMRFVHTLGGGPNRYVIVGCEPARVDEVMGLSQEVAAAVDEAIAIVRGLVCV